MTIFTMKGGKLEPIAVVKGGKTRRRYDEFVQRPATLPAAAPAEKKQAFAATRNGTCGVPFFFWFRLAARGHLPAADHQRPDAGSVYALVALGYTMVYGIIQLINFAHGEVVMIGAHGRLHGDQRARAASGLPPLAVVLIGTGCARAGLHAGRLRDRAARLPAAAQRAAPGAADHRDRRVDHPAAPRADRSGAATSLAVPADHHRRAPTVIGGAAITNVQIAILVISRRDDGAGSLLLVYRTQLGSAMRATAQNPQVAGLMGIDINRVIAATFVIGAALGAVAGVMFGTYYGIAQYTMGFLLGLKAFTAAVLGGIGNLAGAMLGGVLLGLIEALGAGYIGDLTDLASYGGSAGASSAATASGNFVLFGCNYQDVFAFIVLILVLVFRPSGLLGERVGDRA